MSRVALVSGGSRGLGRAIAHRLARDGWDVALTARGADELAAVADEVAAATGVRAVAVPADLTDDDEARRSVAAVVERLGRLDCLVNNAGASRFGYFTDQSMVDWRDAFALKLFGYVALARAAVDQMLACSEPGCVVNIAGAAGRQSMPGHMVGGAVNAAVIHFTRSLSLEVAGRGIRVNAVSPGPTATTRILALADVRAAQAGTTREDELRGLAADAPIGRLAEPAEIAAVVAFLASPEAAYITGENILVDGGATRGG